jgi:hypothetical protein
LFFICAGSLVLGALILFLDLFIAFLGAIALSRAVPLALRGTEVIGHVAEATPGPGRIIKVRVEYQAPEGTFKTGGTSQRSRIGEPVTVRYDPARPARATTWIRLAPRVALGIPVMLLVAVASVGMISGSVFYFAGVHGTLQPWLVSGGFALAMVLVMASFAGRQYAQLLRWRRMVQVPGKIEGFRENVTNGVLISFESADGREEFWATTGSVVARVGDTVTVYYDPARPVLSATVEQAATVRSYAIGGTVLTLVCLAGVAFAVSQL